MNKASTVEHLPLSYMTSPHISLDIRRKRDVSGLNIQFCHSIPVCNPYAILFFFFTHKIGIVWPNWMTELIPFSSQNQRNQLQIMTNMFLIKVLLNRFISEFSPVDNIYLLHWKFRNSRPFQYLPFEINIVKTKFTTVASIWLCQTWKFIQLFQLIISPPAINQNQTNTQQVSVMPSNYKNMHDNCTDGCLWIWIRHKPL